MYTKPEYLTMMSSFSTIYKEGGILQFWKGLVPRMTRIICEWTFGGLCVHLLCGVWHPGCWRGFASAQQSSPAEGWRCIQCCQPCIHLWPVVHGPASQCLPKYAPGWSPLSSALPSDSSVSSCHIRHREPRLCKRELHGDVSDCACIMCRCHVHFELHPDQHCGVLGGSAETAAVTASALLATLDKRWGKAAAATVISCLQSVINPAATLDCCAHSASGEGGQTEHKPLAAHRQWYGPHSTCTRVCAAPT